MLADFQDEVVHNVKRAMLVLLGAVAFVLLISCVNVANLLLARAEARRKEIAVRTAIGASLWKLLQQFVTEGILLSLAGGVFGSRLAFAGLRLLVATNAGSIPRVQEINVDWRVLLFTLSLSIATGILFGLAPVLHVRTSKLHDTLKSAAGRTTGAAAASRFRAGLVTSELALALILLIGSGLMVKAFWKLQQVDAGLDPEHLLTMQVTLPAASYNNIATANGFWSSLLARMRTVPGVVGVSIASGLPPDRRINANDTPIEGFVPVPNGPIQNVDYWNYVSAGYFETLGARLMDGRLLNENDGAAAPPVVVINQTMARTFWPRESAIGHRVAADFSRTGPGAVADHRGRGGRRQERRARPRGRHGVVHSLSAALDHSGDHEQLHRQCLRGDSGKGRPHVAGRGGAGADPRPGPSAADFESDVDGRCDVDGAVAVAVPDAAADVVLVGVAGAGGAGDLRSDFVFGSAADERDRDPDGVGRAIGGRGAAGERDGTTAGAGRHCVGGGGRFRTDSIPERVVVRREFGGPTDVRGDGWGVRSGDSAGMLYTGSAGE